MESGVVNLTQEFDARVWAKEWLRIIGEHPDVPTDEGAMIGWFSNALVAGFDEANRRRVGEAGALYAFMGWLTCREKEAGPFSGKHNAGEAAELVKQFCDSQGWDIEDPDWHKKLKSYPG